MRYEISSNRTNDRAWMSGHGRSEADHDAQRRRTPARAAPEVAKRLIQYEWDRRPSLSRRAAAAAALSRLRRDNR